MGLGCLLSLLLAFALCPFAEAASPSASQFEFFEQRIRPVLVAECYECHAGKKRKGGLALDHRDGVLKGGDSGPAIVPGKPDQSLLIRSLTHADPELMMPKNAPKLDAKVIVDFATWVKLGAPDPRDQPAAATAPPAASWADTLAARRQWWSFQPVKPPAVPPSKNAAWSTQPVDRFLLAKMEEHGLQPAADAEPRVLIRRLSFALTGLPPTPEEVQAFVKDFSLSPSPPLPPARRESGKVAERESEQRAVAALVDRLLSSSAFGERWARHWLDLVRYADSHGSESDPDIPFAWRYRDYLVRAFNADVPAHQLIREHLAGDLLPPAQTRWNKADGLNESLVGLAHLRLVEHGFQPVDTLDDQVRAVENQIDVLGKAFQGITIACARCHDHKFDPISQRDYTALYGVLASSRPAQLQVDAPELLNRNRAALLALKAQIKSALAESWRDAVPPLLAQLTRGSSADPQLAALHQAVADHERELAAIESEARARAIGARAASPRVSNAPEFAGKLPALRLPQPISRWSFDTDARDQLGSLHGELLGGATIRNGRLILDGQQAHLRTTPLGRELREKTLEAWVALANLDQQGSGVLTVETSAGAVFDSLVFGERERLKWVNGSDSFRRSRALDGVAETAKPGEFVHVAVAYRADGTVAFFRNGIAYAPPHKPAAPLVTFPADAHVLLGRRHTGGGRAFLAGEIDEARLYDRALTAEEIAASFQAGPIGVSAEEIGQAMTPEQKVKHAALTTALAKARADRAAKAPADSQPGEDTLAAALKEAQGNLANPLHAWAKLSKLAGPALTSGWTDGTKNWRAQLDAAREHNAKLKPEWDFAKGDAAKWFTEGNAFGRDALPRVHPGDFALEPDGDRLLKGLLPAAVSTHLLSEKHGGLFTSPRFRITTDSMSVRAAGGKGAMVRVIVDNYPLGSNPIFPKAELTRDELGWIRMDTAYRKGSWAYLEFGTADDLTRKLGRSSDASGRSWFSAERVVSHDKDAPRDEPLAPAPLLASAQSPKSAAELATHYERTLRTALDAWARGSVSAEQTAFLDFFLRRGLLPASLKSLPKVAPLVAEYRRLESEIVAPRRAPGVIEGTACDAPLMPRGDHTKPGPAVPRGYLEVLGAKEFLPVAADVRRRSGEAKDVRLVTSAATSGRLALAEAIASPQNPLTARVLVNRVWQHLFGRGLVPTVDNFGRLGDQPTHPELLDHLAARFVAEGWSFKKLIRELVTTRAYQLSSEASPRARETDAANTWLSHAPVRRLEAEAIRDSLLAVSGRLDRTMFGAGAGGNGTPRRSVYLTVRRTNLNPFLETFDAPKPFTTLGRRDATNVPAQSLALLNDPFVIDLARAWAAALLARQPDADARVREMFAAAFARQPSADELAKARAFLAELAREANVPDAQLAASERVWQDFAQSLFNLKEFIYTR